jgi:uncharacterized protein (DUF1800 family)
MKLSCSLLIPAVWMASPGFAQTAADGTHRRVPEIVAGTADVMTSVAAARFLDQATWGPTPSSMAELQSLGITEWLNRQFTARSSDLPDQPILTSTGTSNNNLAPVQAAFFENTLRGEDQLRQRVAFALSQIWVVSATSGVSAAYAYPPYWRVFRDHAFGNYKDLIRAVTLDPAMGRYLDMANSNKADPATGTAANENYGRELMQLFTLGLTQLNPDGSAVVDQNNNPVPTYDQAVVTNMAKLLTGWTYPTAPGATPRNNNNLYYFGSMFAVQVNHDTTAKVIFNNITVPAGQTAEQDLESLLNALMQNTSMAPFVSQQLIQHLVTSNPSPQYIQRVSSVFTNDGSGVTGNLQAVITAILTDPEARAGDDPSAAISPNYGHMREPILFMANVLRGLNGTLGPSSAIYNNASAMGEDLFYAPSVFSYFPPQYRTENGLLGPEFEIYSTQTAADRANIVNTLLYGALDKSTMVNLAPFASQAEEAGALLSYISSIFLHGVMPAALEQAATDAFNAATTTLSKAQAALYVVLTSGDYQIIQ